MSSIFEIMPKLKLFNKGTCFVTKHEMLASKKPGVTSSNNLLGFENFDTIIPKNTVLIFLEDKQFYSPSKELKQPMSAWIRAKVITPLGDMVWITLSCDNKVNWDFKTYNGKKNFVVKEVEESFQVLSLSINSTNDVLLKPENEGKHV